MNATVGHRRVWDQLSRHSCGSHTIPSSADMQPRSPSEGYTYDNNYLKWICLATCHAILQPALHLVKIITVGTGENLD